VVSKKDWGLVSLPGSAVAKLFRGCATEDSPSGVEKKGKTGVNRSRKGGGCLPDRRWPLVCTCVWGGKGGKERGSKRRHLCGVKKMEKIPPGGSKQTTEAAGRPAREKKFQKSAEENFLWIILRKLKKRTLGFPRSCQEPGGVGTETQGGTWAKKRTAFRPVTTGGKAAQKKPRGDAASALASVATTEGPIRRRGGVQNRAFKNVLACRTKHLPKTSGK